MRIHTPGLLASAWLSWLAAPLLARPRSRAAEAFGCDRRCVWRPESLRVL